MGSWALDFFLFKLWVYVHMWICYVCIHTISVHMFTSVHMYIYKTFFRNITF